MTRFVTEGMDAAVAPKPPKIDSYMIFLRGFSGSPERQRVEEYLRGERDTASRNKLAAVNDNNQTGVDFYSGCQHSCDGLLAWLASYDLFTAE